MFRNPLIFSQLCVIAKTTQPLRTTTSSSRIAACGND